MWINCIKNFPRAAQLSSCRLPIKPGEPARRVCAIQTEMCFALQANQAKRTDKSRFHLSEDRNSQIGFPSPRGRKWPRPSALSRRERGTATALCARSFTDSECALNIGGDFNDGCVAVIGEPAVFGNQIRVRAMRLDSVARDGGQQEDGRVLRKIARLV